jgi:hypothetical protein
MLLPQDKPGAGTLHDGFGSKVEVGASCTLSTLITLARPPDFRLGLKPKVKASIRDVCLSAAYHTTDAEGLYCAARQIWLLNVRSGSIASFARLPAASALPPIATRSARALSAGMGQKQTSNKYCVKL